MYEYDRGYWRGGASDEVDVLPKSVDGTWHD